jgi:hypothetical protein
MATSIISLTTIPPRMDRIRPTLESLARQTAKIDAVILWIPRSYRRPEFGSFTLPGTPSGVEIRRSDVDYGPATKVLPAVEAFRGSAARILYCDDDRVYDPGWAARLLAASDAHPTACMTEVGEVVALTLRKAFKATPAYRRLTLATLGVFGGVYRRGMRALEVGVGRVDICKGYGGVLVRPEFFSPAAFDIPDLLWTVDDIWLSGQLALSGVPILKIAETEMATKTEVADVAPLLGYVYADHRREQANVACIRHFQERYGIWNGPGTRAGRVTSRRTPDAP